MSLYTDIKAARDDVDRARRRLLELLTTAVVLRDGSLCHYCGVPTLITRLGHPQQRTVDHIVPVLFGGKDDLDNLVLCCRSCNSRKGAQVSQSLLCPRCRPRARTEATP